MKTRQQKTPRQRMDAVIKRFHGKGQTVEKILVSPTFYERLNLEYNEYLASLGTYQQNYEKKMTRFRGCIIEVNEELIGDFYII